MRRMGMKRWWAFLLTLVLLSGSVASIPPPSFANNGDVVIGDPDAGTLPGDPDGPGGPSKKSPTGGRLSPGGNGYAAAPVGDGGRASSVWSWRYHVVLWSLISRWYRL